MKTVMLTIKTLMYTIWSLLYFCRMINTLRSCYLEPEILHDYSPGKNMPPTVRSNGHSNSSKNLEFNIT